MHQNYYNGEKVSRENKCMKHNKIKRKQAQKKNANFTQNCKKAPYKERQTNMFLNVFGMKVLVLSIVTMMWTHLLEM